MIIIILFLLGFSVGAESVSTNLTDPKMIEIYHDVTSKIRCICLPSLPIKSCSYNNCAVSAELKLFIENRIRMGEDSDSIVRKMQNGFGESVLTDPIIKKFQLSGSTGMVEGVVYGFGDKILAEPSPFGINLTIGLAGLFGLFLILYYFRKNSGIKKTLPTNSEFSVKKYMEELD